MLRIEIDNAPPLGPRRITADFLERTPKEEIAELDCPSIDEIRRTVDEDRSIFETRELVEHLSGCVGCFAAWREARATRRGKLLTFPSASSPISRTAR